MRLVGFECLRCRSLYAIVDGGDRGFVEALLRQPRTCPVCEKKGEASRLCPTLNEGGHELILRLKPKELWDYLNGLGLPTEQARPEVVRELLLGSKVVDADIQSTVNPARCVVDRLRLDNGKTLHFAASGAGAVIFKVTEEQDARKGAELRDHPREEGPEEHASGREAGPASDVADH